MSKRIVLLFIIAVSFSSCRLLKPSMMFRAPANFAFDSVPSDSSFRLKSQYDIMPNDEIKFQIYSNDGFKLVDLASSELGLSTKANSELTYTIDREGFLKLPVIGKVNLVGKTIREAESFLEELFSKFYNKPFVVLNVTSRRVYVFPGTAGAAKSVKINNNNTTLIDVLTQVGGIQSTGKAYKVRIIRDYDLKTPKVYQVDLSRIEGLKFASFPVQNHDIIYIEPKSQYAQSISGVIAPYLTLLSTTLLIVGYYKILTK